MSSISYWPLSDCRRPLDLLGGLGLRGRSSHAPRWNGIDLSLTSCNIIIPLSLQPHSSYQLFIPIIWILYFLLLSPTNLELPASPHCCWICIRSFIHSCMRAHITAAVAFLPAYFSHHCSCCILACILLTSLQLLHSCLHTSRVIYMPVFCFACIVYVVSGENWASVRVMTWLHCVCVFRYTLCSFSTLTGCYKQKQFTKWIKVDIYQMQSWNESTHNTPSLFHTSDNRQLKTDMNQR